MRSKIAHASTVAVVTAVALWSVGCVGADTPTALDPIADEEQQMLSCGPDNAIVMFENEDWYREVDGSHSEFPGDSWRFEVEFKGTLREEIYEPPPPHRPAVMWLDEVRLYTGSPEATSRVQPWLDRQIGVFGKRGMVCPLGDAELCVYEIWPARVWLLCP